MASKQKLRTSIGGLSNLILLNKKTFTWLYEKLCPNKFDLDKFSKYSIIRFVITLFYNKYIATNPPKGQGDA